MVFFWNKGPNRTFRLIWINVISVQSSLHTYLNRKWNKVKINFGLPAGVVSVWNTSSQKMSKLVADLRLRSCSQKNNSTMGSSSKWTHPAVFHFGPSSSFFKKKSWARKQNFNFKLLRILFSTVSQCFFCFFSVNRDLTKIDISRQKLTKSAKRKLVKLFLKFHLPGNTKIYVFITEICIFITQ